VPRNVTYASTREAMKLYGEPGVLFLDARLPQEYARSHIAGALDLPVERFERYYPRLKSRLRGAKTLVCYCESISCDEGARLSARLAGGGYDNVVFMFAGWEEWQQAGYPVASGQKARR
jgi:rhodanese-related sulfurtransferase